MQPTFVAAERSAIGGISKWRTSLFASVAESIISDFGLKVIAHAVILDLQFKKLLCLF